jgi:nucleotide-binding universal stress UspA family protein
MIKRILVALDPDEDTPLATKYAIQLARRFKASLTGLAIVDMEDIYASVGTGGIGTIYYAEKLREFLTEENRTEAQKLLAVFRDTVEEAGIDHFVAVEEGVPYERIVEEMKYHDLLILGRDSHFFYTRPEKETSTLPKVIKRSIAPTLIATEQYRDVERVLVAFDESAASARALQSFVHLLPYGKNVEIELAHVVSEDSDEARDEAKFLLRLAKKYLAAHHFESIRETVLTGGKPGEKLLEQMEKSEPDMVILGAHSMSAIKRVTFGSTTYDLIRKSPAPLFVSS